MIRYLLKTDSLPKILENADPSGLERLINNFSPAQMALESEVLNCTLPVLIYFYQNQVADGQLLEQLAQEYDDKIKIVTIDSEQFFSIAAQFEINTYPTFVFVNRRDEIKRHVGNASKDQLVQLMNVFLM